MTVLQLIVLIILIYLVISCAVYIHLDAGDMELHERVILGALALLWVFSVPLCLVFGVIDYLYKKMKKNKENSH